MVMKTINYNVSLNGITPSVEQFAGTQGDHRVTKVNFTLSDELYESIMDVTTTTFDGPPALKGMYRFDVYDGEGGIWQSDVKTCEKTVSLELEERHTRFGGKITVYLVITLLDSDKKTNTELYFFPAKLKLQNRPEGIYKEGENAQSVSGLCDAAKTAADSTRTMMSRVSVLAEEARVDADRAEESVKTAQELSARIVENLKNGEYDGVGIKKTEVVDGQLLVTYTDGITHNAGVVMGERGEQGPKGDQGDIGPVGPSGKDAVVEQHFSETSENAQSGKAITEALQNYKKKTDQPDWEQVEFIAPDYIKNRTHGMTIDFIVWDGDETNKYISLLDTDYKFVKVTDKIYTPEELIGGSITTYGPVEVLFDNVIESFEITNCVDASQDKNGSVYEVENKSYGCWALLVTVPTTHDIYGALEPGLYFKKEVREGGNYVISLTTNKVVMKLERKYLPDDVPQIKDNGNIITNTPIDDLDCANKVYVDEQTLKIENSKIPRPTDVDWGAPFNSVVAFDNSNYSVDIEGNYTINDTAFKAIDVDAGELGKGAENTAGMIPTRDKYANLWTCTPISDLDCANKKYVDDLIGDIETLLGGI